MYCVMWCDGRTWWGFETIADSVAAIRRLEPDAKVGGHPGDLSSGGDHTLAWASETDAADGRPAVAMVLRVE